MSNTIDQKVVEMRFDNKNFESNVSTSMSTLDKLKKALRFDGATKGLENVSSAAKKCDMSSVSNAVQNVHAKFSALEVMGVTALVNITNKAMAAGQQLAKAFTIDPIKSGFQEYETQINAVQTILANTSHAGTTLDDVNGALDELNTYADKTIYNFTEMTRNIGTFTAAGVDLDTSVNAIKGIANLAAVSGSTSQQASTAMYQLSQALASGTVKLMDWNSVVNAGMGGKVFQDALIRTSELLGTGAKAAIEAEGNFRESLTKSGWLTTEVLTETLKQFAGAYSEADLISQGYTKSQAEAIAKMAVTATDAATKVKTFTQLMDTLKEATQSGWTQSWEIMIGDFEEAKAFFTEISDFFGEIIDASSKARNTMLEGAFGSPWAQLEKKINDAGVETETFQSILKDTMKTHNVSLDRAIKEEGSLAAAIQNGRVKSEHLKETFENLIYSQKGFQEALDKTAKSHHISLSRMIKEEGSFAKALKKISPKIISEALDEYVNNAEKYASATGVMTDKLEYFQKVVNEVWGGKYGNGADRVKALTKAGYDYATVQDLVNKTVDGHKLTLEDLSDAQLEATGLTKDQIVALRDLAKEANATGTPLSELIERMYKPSGRELAIMSLRNGLQAIVKVCSAVKSAWTDAFPPMTSEQLYDIIEVVHSVTESLVMTDETADKLTRTLKGVFAVFDIFTTIVGGGLKFGLKAIAALLKGFDLNILDVTASIGDMLVGFRNWIDEHNYVYKGLEAIGSAIKNSIPLIKGWYKAFKELPIVKEIIGEFANISDTYFGGIVNGFYIIKDGINGFVEDFKAIDWSNLTIEDLQSWFEKFYDSITTGFKSVMFSFDDIKAGFDRLVDAAGVYLQKLKTVAGIYLKKFADIAKENLGKAGDFISDIYDKIKNFVSYITEKIDINWGAIFAIATGAAVITFLIQLGKLFKYITEFNLGDMLGIGNVLDAYAKKVKAQALKENAMAIGILAASVAILALLPFDKVWKAALVLVALGGALVGFAFAMSKIGDVGKVSISMSAVAGGLLLLAGAMYLIKDMEPGQLGKAVVALAVAALGMIGVAKLLTSKEARQLPKGSLFLLGFATAIGILAKALVTLENTPISGSTMVQLLAIIAGLSLVTAAAKGVKASAALALMASVFAVKMVIELIEDLAEFDGTTILKGVVKLIPVIITYRALLTSTKRAGTNAGQAGLAILAISASILLLTRAIKAIADIKVKDILKAGAVIVVLETVFAALIYISKYAGEHAAEAGKMLLLMSAAMLILSGVIAILAKIAETNVKGLWNAVAAITVLEAAFGGLIFITKYARRLKGLTPVLITLTAAVAVISVCIAALSMIEKDNLMSASTSLTMVIGVFALLIAATSKLQKGFKSFVRVTTTLVIITAVVGALAVIIRELSKVSPESAIGSAKALSTLLLALTGSLYILDKVKGVSTSAIGALFGVGIAVGLIGVLVGTLEKWDLAPSIDTALALSILLGAMTLVTGALALIGPVATMAVKGAIGMLAVISLISAFVLLIAAFEKDIPSEETMDKVVNFLESVGSAIGSFVGGILGGLAEGVMSSMPKIGEHLEGFWNNSKDFFSGISRLDDKASNGAKVLADVLSTLISASFTNAIANLFGFKMSFETFGQQICAFGKAMVDYSKVVSGNIDNEALTASANAGKTLAELANSLPAAEGTFMSWFNGKVSLGEFSKQIKAFGTAIVGYSLIVSGSVDSKAVTSSASAGKALSELANSLPSAEGTWAHWFTGKVDLATFGIQIKAFAHAIVGYNNILVQNGGINEKAIKTSTSAGTMLAELANSLPSAEGTWAYWFTGKIDMAAFSTQIQTFARAIVGYSNTLTRGNGIDVKAIEASTNAAMTLTTLANKLPPADGTWADYFNGTMDLATFGANLKSFGIDFLSYSNYMRNVDTSVVDATANAATSLVTLAKGLPEDKFFTNEVHLDEFGAELALFGGSFAKYYDTISHIVPDTLSKVVTEIWRLLNLFTQMQDVDFNGASGFSASLNALAKAGIDDFIKEFDNSSGKVSDAARKFVVTFTNAANSKRGDLTDTFIGLMDSVLTSIKVKQTDFQLAGSDTMFKFILGIRSRMLELNDTYSVLINNSLTTIKNKFYEFERVGNQTMIKYIGGVREEIEEVNKAFEACMLDALDVIESYYDEFNDAGEALAEGFAEGIADSAYLAEIEAEAMAAAAARAAEAALQINSPSKVFYRIGEYAGMGLVNAFGDYEEKAAKAGEGLATATLYTVASTIANLSALIEDGIDTTPTITPVLDLSEVEAQSSRLNTLFSHNKAMSIGSSINTRATSLNNQNGVETGTNTSTGNTYQFTQNNYSPKALSRIEIYRQTKNQFSTFERRVKA